MSESRKPRELTLSGWVRDRVAEAAVHRGTSVGWEGAKGRNSSSVWHRGGLVMELCMQAKTLPLLYRKELSRVALLPRCPH